MSNAYGIYIKFLNSLTTRVFGNRADLKFELKKIAIARAFLSGFSIYKTLQNLTDYIAINDISGVASFDLSVWLLLSLIAASTLTFFGLLTTVSALLMAILSYWSDHNLGINGLGSAAFANVTLIIILTPSGQYYSLDKKLGLSTKKFLRLKTRCSHNYIIQTYVVAFLIFCATNLASAIGHLMNDHWVNLTAIQKTLENPFYSVFYEFFARLSKLNEPFWGFVTKLLTLMQLIWQIMMLPLVMWYPSRLFVILWGFAFFLISEFCLHLGFLDKWLLCFWILVFLPSPNDLRLSSKEALHHQRTVFNKFTLFPHLITLPFFFSFFIATCSTAYTIKESAAALSIKSRTFQIKERIPQSTLALYDFASIAGLIAPNVFNKKDMDAAYLFAVLEKSQSTSEIWELVPFIDHDGSRLEMHTSDLVRYQISIPLRRCLQTEKWKDCLSLAAPIIRLNDLVAGAKYRIKIIDSTNKKTTIFALPVNAIYKTAQISI